MVATRDISALEVILSERAAAVGPKLCHSPVCVECLAEVDLDSPQVCSVERRAKHHRHLGQVAQQYPLPDIAKSTEPPSTLTRSSSDDNVES